MGKLSCGSVSTGKLVGDMDVRIGQTAANAAALRGPARPLPVGLGNTEREPTLAEKSLRRPDSYHKVQVGFGEDTQSPATAALDTLDVNLREARRVVPSIEELMEEARARQQEIRAGNEAVPAGVSQLSSASETQESVFFKPDAAPQAREFMQAVSSQLVTSTAPTGEELLAPRLDVLV